MIPAVAQRLAVAVTTYRRPKLLHPLLPVLVAHAEAARTLKVDADVIVVDNDPARSAEAVVADWILGSSGDPGMPRVTYVHEPIPGISAARNRALSSADDREFLVFIDDDETPGERWLELLVETQRRFDCAAVLGPVLADYQVDPDPWIVAGGFFVRPRGQTGSIRRVGFTGNLLLDLRVVRSLGLRFDDAFGLSGGEDSLFTSQLTRGGGVIRWCDEAYVLDLVPPERASRRWVLMRRFRSGTSHSRVAMQMAGTATSRAGQRVVLTGTALTRVIGGSARALVGVVIRSNRHHARGMRTAFRGAGMLAGAWGYNYREYKREAV